MEDLTEDFEKEVVESQENIKIQELNRQIANYRKTLAIYGIEELIEMSDIEYICIKEIAKLRKLSDTYGLTNDDVKSLDTLHKNLRAVRMKDSKLKPKNDSFTEEELIRIAKENEQA